MRLHRNQLAIRIGGSLVALGFLGIGLYALLGGGEAITEVQRERALGFGLTACIGGVWALVVSWLDPDLSGVWCRPPKRWK